MINNHSIDLKNTSYSLSIQLSLNGFSFCIATAKGTIISSYIDNNSKQLLNELELRNKIIEIFTTKPELQAEFHKVEVIHCNELTTFVPTSLFDKSIITQYLHYSIKTLATDNVDYQNITENGITNVFIPYTSITEFLTDHLGELNSQHSSSLLVKSILKENKIGVSEKIYLHFYPNQFDIIITKGNTLHLFNSFSYVTNDDVLYYVLFCIEQINANPNNIPVILLNQIDTELYELLYTFIRTVHKNQDNLNNNLLHRLALSI